MNQVQIVAYDKRGDGLARIKEISMAHHYTGIPFEILRSSIGVFILEVCRNVIREHEANFELYQFIEKTFLQLDKEDISYATFHIEFLLALSEFIGFAPMNNYSQSLNYFHLMNGQFESQSDGAYTLSPELSAYMHNLLSHHNQPLSIPKSCRLQLLNALMTYYKLHMDSFREIKSLAVLSEVL